MTAFVYSQLDYCNGALKGVAAGTIGRLQLILHAAAAGEAGRWCQITPVIRDYLRWLPFP